MRLIPLLVLFVAAFIPSPASAAAPAPPSVKIVETPDAYILSNGIIRATVLKRSGALNALQFNGTEVLNGDPRHPGGYWSHAAAAARMSQSITINPKTNDGARGEIGLYTYAIFTHLPRYPATSIGEARFCAKLSDKLFDWMTVDARRNQEAITAYDWDHGTVMNMKEARRMNSGKYKGHVEHKYDYTAVQFDTPAFGWSSTKQPIGAWFINPTIEYLSGGPTKVELCVHRDATFGSNLDAPAPPCLLNYWRGSHYGGSSCVIAAGESWTKVIGPFLIYCNAGPTPVAMWKEALTQAAREAKAWPYEWVNGVDYPHRAQRASVSGQLTLDDPQAHSAGVLKMPPPSSSIIRRADEALLPPPVLRGRVGVGAGPLGAIPSAPTLPARGQPPIPLASPGVPGEGKARHTLNGIPSEVVGAPATFSSSGRAAPLTHLLVGLTAPDYTVADRRGRSSTVDWQLDAKHYQFWVRAGAQGHFSIPNVRPGVYTLHAIADNVLGEYAKADITVLPGKPLELGHLQWKPLRFGRQLWEIGIPDRTAGEFLHGDHYWQWGLYNEYPKDFPGDVNFTIGKSDYHKDWNYCQCPRPDRLNGTPWSIIFNLPNAPHGKATLRLSFAATSARHIDATMNDKSAGSSGPLRDTAAIRRDDIRGYWYERDIPFDAALMKAGENVLKLTIPPAGVMSGVEYDYLRLELKEK